MTNPMNWVRYPTTVLMLAAILGTVVWAPEGERLHDFAILTMLAVAIGELMVIGWNVVKGDASRIYVWGHAALGSGAAIVAGSIFRGDLPLVSASGSALMLAGVIIFARKGLR